MSALQVRNIKMSSHRYHKKTKKDRKRQKRIVILTACLVGAAIVGASVLYFLHERASQHREIGYEDDTAGTESGAVVYDGVTYTPNDHLSNYLFLGVDTSASLADSAADAPGNAGQADAIYLVSYDRVEKTRRVIAIPRDSMTEIETFSPDGTSLGFAKTHLSLQYAYGDGRAKSCTLMETAVSKLLLGVKVSGYAAVNLESIPYLTELVDYVDVTVPDDSLADVDPAFTKGATVRLTADNTEEFVRTRDIDVSQSAITRMNRQIAYITGYANRVRALQQEDSGTVARIYDGLTDHMVTNMTSDIFLDLEQAETAGDIETVPGEGQTGDVYDEYIVDQDQLYEMILKDFYNEQ